MRGKSETRKSLALVHYSLGERLYGCPIAEEQFVTFLVCIALHYTWSAIDATVTSRSAQSTWQPSPVRSRRARPASAPTAA